MSRISNSGRFMYATGFKSYDAAFEALCDMINNCETSEAEAEIESYSFRKDGKKVRRFAITHEL